MAWGPDSDISAFVAADLAKAAARTDVDYSGCDAHPWALAFAEANPDARLVDLFEAMAAHDDIDVPMWGAVLLEHHRDDLWPEARDLILAMLTVNPGVKTWLAYEKVAQWLTPEETQAVMQAILSIGEEQNPTLVRWAQQVIGGN